MNTNFVIYLIASYLLGSIPSSLWIGKLFYKTDIRSKGSGSSGATNALRTLGWKAALPVLLIDLSKGIAATQLAFLLKGFNEHQFYHIQIIYGVAAVLGHIFPVLANFRGGKGVATLTGIILILTPEAGAICVLIFLIITFITRYVSLGSLITALLYPLIIYLLSVFAIIPKDKILLAFAALTFFIVFITHRANIIRLLDKEENKISFRKKTTEND